jgi:hypothetical protein
LTDKGFKSLKNPDLGKEIVKSLFKTRAARTPQIQSVRLHSSTNRDDVTLMADAQYITNDHEKIYVLSKRGSEWIMSEFIYKLDFSR